MNEQTLIPYDLTCLTDNHNPCRRPYNSGARGRLYNDFGNSGQQVALLKLRHSLDDSLTELIHILWLRLRQTAQ
jgi:hypothetical protein